MKRDPRLRGLSSEHHAALVLAQRLRQASREDRLTAALAREVAERFAREIEPHFVIEDELLIPGLREAGEGALADRLTVDHADLRALVAQAPADPSVLTEISERLAAHVRFEERVVFPRSEEVLPDTVLDAIGLRAPKEP